MDRREFIRGLATAATLASLAAPRFARAIGERSKLTCAALIYDGAWNPRPTALRRLLFEVGHRTSIAAAFEPAGIDLRSDALFAHPLLYWSGTGAFKPLDEKDVVRLRRYVSAGGFVLADSAQETGDDFAAAVRREIARAFPASPLQPLPPEHVVYKSFYMLRGAAGRIARTDRLEGAAIDGRTAVILSHNDLGGAWARDNLDNWEHPVEPGGEDQRERAIRLGVNLVMYAMCLDYKDDQVHAPFIMRRRGG
mgnify:CR=1 FL=1